MFIIHYYNSGGFLYSENISSINLKIDSDSLKIGIIILIFFILNDMIDFKSNLV